MGSTELMFHMPEGKKQLVIFNLYPIHLVHCKMAADHEKRSENGDLMPKKTMNPRIRRSCKNV